MYIIYLFTGSEDNSEVVVTESFEGNYKIAMVRIDIIFVLYYTKDNAEFRDGKHIFIGL